MMMQLNWKYHTEYVHKTTVEICMYIL